MSEVRKHQRRTASGRLTTVRRHTRDVDSAGDGEAAAPDGEEVQPWRPPHVSALPPAGGAGGGETFWDDDPEPAGEWWDRGPVPEPPALAGMKAQMREWRARDVHVPPGVVDTSPKGRLLGLDTQEGADRFARLEAYRDAGYDGPLDRDDQIPDPDAPGNQEWLRAGAALRDTHPAEPELQAAEEPEEVAPEPAPRPQPKPRLPARAAPTPPPRAAMKQPTPADDPKWKAQPARPFGPAKKPRRTRAQRKKALADYKKARAALNRYHSRTGEETKRYLQLNRAVIEAERNIPWWRRW